MIVLGIDPGSRHLGYGLVESESLRPICVGTLHIAHSLKIPDRLKLVYDQLCELINKHQPQEIAIEKAFAGKKISSSFVLSYIRAVVFLTAAQRDIPIFEYSSTEIKKALTGYGRAHKVQIKAMVKNFLKLNGRLSYDSADALAVAICHVNSRSSNLLIFK